MLTLHLKGKHFIKRQVWSIIVNNAPIFMHNLLHNSEINSKIIKTNSMFKSQQNLISLVHYVINVRDFFNKMGLFGQLLLMTMISQKNYMHTLRLKISCTASRKLEESFMEHYKKRIQPVFLIPTFCQSWRNF